MRRMPKGKVIPMVHGTDFRPNEPVKVVNVVYGSEMRPNPLL